MKFRSVYDRIRIGSNCGSKFLDTYKLGLDDDGRRVLQKTGKINTYEEIQSYKDSCDLKLTIERFARGEIDTLDRVASTYGDFTDLPKNFLELNNKLIDAQNFFDELPVDIKREFDHSVDKFFASIGTQEGFDIMCKFAPETKDIALDNVLGDGSIITEATVHVESEGK